MKKGPGAITLRGLSFLRRRGVEGRTDAGGYQTRVSAISSSPTTAIRAATKSSAVRVARRSPAKDTPSTRSPCHSPGPERDTLKELPARTFNDFVFHVQWSLGGKRAQPFVTVTFRKVAGISVR